MSDTVAEQGTVTGEGTPDREKGPIMVPRPQITDEQTTALARWAEEVCSAAGNVLSTLTERKVAFTVSGQVPVAFTAAEGNWLRADMFIPTGSLSEPGQAVILMHESQGGVIVDVTGGGSGEASGSLDVDGQQLLEEVMSQIVGVLTREDDNLSSDITWGGLDIAEHDMLADSLSDGGWGIARYDITIDGENAGRCYAALCKRSLEHLVQSIGGNSSQPEPAVMAAAQASEARHQTQAQSQPQAQSGNVGAGQGNVVVQSARFKPLGQGAASEEMKNIDIIVDVPLQLTVELGRTTRKIKDVLSLSPGAVVELDRLAGEAVDVLVNGKLVAKGEVVVIDENFGVRITDIVSPMERVSHVG